MSNEWKYLKVESVASKDEYYIYRYTKIENNKYVNLQHYHENKWRNWWGTRIIDKKDINISKLDFFTIIAQNKLAAWRQ